MLISLAIFFYENVFITCVVFRDASRDEECQDDIRMMTPSPTASDEPRSSKGGGR